MQRGALNSRTDALAVWRLSRPDLDVRAAFQNATRCGGFCLTVLCRYSSLGSSFSVEDTCMSSRCALGRIHAQSLAGQDVFKQGRVIWSKNKVSPRGRRDDMHAPRRWRWQKSRRIYQSTFVRGRVRSPHISGGQRRLSCRQQACLACTGSCVMGQTYGRIALFQSASLGRGFNKTGMRVIAEVCCCWQWRFRALLVVACEAR